MSWFDFENYIAKPNVILSECKTYVDLSLDEDEIEEKLSELRQKISDKQNVMFAHNKHAFLICLQGMDTSGKDSFIREVFKECNPSGVVVHSFKTPTSLELEHDYLWRHNLALPQKGTFSIFNRTHYENVLVTRVHPEYILSENLPNINSVEDITPQFWSDRMQQITNFEQHISQNGTKVLKFYFNISKEEQRLRLLHRLENIADNWKFSTGDLKEREHWDTYMACYQDAIAKTTTSETPWYIIPSDDKKVCRLIVAKIIWEELQKLTDIKEPELEEKVRANIEVYKNQLKE